MPRRWALGLALGLFFVVVLVAAGWRDLLRARGQLSSAREELERVVDDPTALESGPGRSRAKAGIDEAIGRVGSAHDLVDGSVPLRLAGWLPGFGRQRSGALNLIADAGHGAAVARELLNTVDDLADRTRIEGGRIPTEGLARLETAVRRAGRGLRTIQQDGGGLWASLAAARRDLTAASRRASTSLLDGADAIHASRALMGADGPRRYLVAVQNNAEMRDQGMVLSYAVITFDQGQLVVDRTGPITDFDLDTSVDVVIPASTERVFGSQNPRRMWQNVNATADWPTSARTMAAMYRQASGEDIDGVIALDVPGLASLLRVIGPVPNPGGSEEINADNASRILLHDFYAQVPRGLQSLRKERLGEVSATIVARLVTGTHDAIGLGRALGAAAAGGHFRLWSKHEDEESVFRRVGLGGGPAETLAERTVHISVQNASSTKLDYFQRQRVRMDVYVTEVGTAVVRTSLTLVNTAPRNAEPSYQLGPGGVSQTKPGEYPARIYFWGPRGGAQATGVPESGLTLSSTSALVQPGERETVVFDAAIPKAVRDGRLELRLVPQPTLVPADLTVKIHAPGWSVHGEASFSRAWDRTMTVGWDLER